MRNLYRGLLSGASFLAAERRAINAAVSFDTLSDCGHHATTRDKTCYWHDFAVTPLLNPLNEAYECWDEKESLEKRL
jgi:hypothetical protein